MADPNPPATSTAEIHNESITPGPDPTKDNELLSPEDGGKAQKGQGLLQVPSRSSSQKNQSSPTSTGLSGATVSDSRNSISGQSKDSKGSIMDRHRNGSTSSRTGGDTEPNNSPPNSQPHSPATSAPRKKRGFLSFLGCCGVPDSANAVDEESENVHKVGKLPVRAATAKSKPQDQTQKPLSEKAPEPQTLESRDQRMTSDVTEDQITAVEENRKQTVGPAVTVEPPNLPKSDGEVGKGAVGDDVVMHNASSDEQNDGQRVTQADEPPPRIAPTSTGLVQGVATGEPSAIEPRKWLLPPIAPEFKGKKCLILDLDETLVHSSFKILHQADFTIPVDIEGTYHNVYVIKRPGVDEFLRRVGQLYEVVVFTASVSKYGDPLLDQLDIHKVVHHRLFRDSCYNHQGNYVKDLSQVGRELQNTIIIDNSPTSYIFHPQHAVPISSWFSDAHDNELLDLVPVLEDLASTNVSDVTLVLDVTL